MSITSIQDDLDDAIAYTETVVMALNTNSCADESSLAMVSIVAADLQQKLLDIQKRVSAPEREACHE
jgi:hypothetical protein